jgi:GrpB-like predicted nucleotidyltransferase (UPF0157 family)
MSEQIGGLGLAQGLVRLAEADPAWPAIFAGEAARLRAALEGHDAAVEHCGSTSVPGLPAKPILDILVGVAAPIDVASIAQALAPLGYEHAPWAGVPGHEVFGKGDPRTHLVHVVPLHGDAWKRMLAFRDALRRDPALAADYAILKRDLAARFSQNRAAYTDAKSRFVETVHARDVPQKD